MENLFIAAFGQSATPEQVLADAKREGVTPQDYVTDCLRVVREQGGTVPEGAFEQLCGELGIEPS